MTQLSSMRPLRRSLPMELLRAREAVMRKFIPSLKEHGLSPQQWRVIRLLIEEDALDATEIGERCLLLNPSVSRILKNLRKRGLLTRATASDDQRRTINSITDEGRELYETIAPVSEARYAHITERFGYGKLELLYELLEELVEKLEEPDAPADEPPSGSRQHRYLKGVR